MSKRGDMIKEMLLKNPDVPSKTLARRIYARYPEWFISLEAAFNSVRYYRGNRGAISRKTKKNDETHRPNGKAGWKPALPKSKAEPWEKYLLPSPSTILVLSDVHIPYHDEEAVGAAVAYAKRHVKPDVILLNGDIADFYSISRWEQNPSKRDLLDEIEHVRDFLGWLRLEFPKAKMVYKLGNHDERWDKYIANKASDLWGLKAITLPEILTRDEDNEPLKILREIEFVSDQRPVMAGKLPIFHGHELGKSVFSPVNQARGAFMRTIHTMLMGHGHRTSSHAEPDLWHKEIVTWSQGCLCDLHPEYARVNKWNHGFAVVETEKDGTFELTNYRIQQGKVRRS